MSTINRIFTLTALAGLSLVAPLASRADLAPVNTGFAAGVYTYNADFAVGTSNDHKLISGDYFTLYDINGLVAGSITTNANFTFTTQFTGVTPAFITPTDSSTIENITFTYTGVPKTADTTFTGFGFTSTQTTAGAGVFTSQDEKKLGANVFSHEGHVGAVLTPSAVPEGSSFLMLLPALLPVGAFLRRRRSAK